MRLHDLFAYHVRTHPERPCIIEDARTLTYADVAREADRLVNALRAAGLKPGDRFGYLSRNSTDVVVAYLAASKSGAVALPLNWRLAPPEWRRILTQGEARLVIAQAEFAEAFDQARPEALGGTYVIDGAREGWHDYRAWLAAQPDVAGPSEGGGASALYQMYTSGTTGEPKGAVIVHDSVIANAMQCMLVFEPRFSPADRTLIVMPLFHAGAASFAMSTLISGAAMIIHREFKPRALADALSGGVTIANLVPVMLQMALTDVPDIAARDYSRLSTIIYGASPIAEDTLRRAIEVFGCQFVQGYGQTEATACVTMLSHADHRRALAGKPELLLSAGRALAGTDIRIVDLEGCDVAPGEIGEVIIRGPQLMQGYWNKPEETARALAGGWLHTGDAGRLNGEGYLYICDRVKDMIISGGENIYPREVENALFAHPGVADAAVIGVPDDTYGESVMAVIVAKEGARVCAEEIVAHCRGLLGGYKIPRRIEFASSLPRNPSGKVLKKELRAPYWEGRARGVG